MQTSDVYETGFDEQNGQTMSAEVCPECDGGLLTEAGEISCRECGLVINEYRLDHAARKATLDDSREQRKRTGAPLTPARHDRGLSSEIGFWKDANGNKLGAGKRRQLGRLRRQHQRARWRSKAERNLAHGCGEIARLTGALDLPRSVRERASRIFREAQREDLLPGRSIESFAAGSVYAACRSDGYLRTIQEVSDVAQRERSNVLNAYRVMNAELGIAATPPTPRDHLGRLLSACGASADVRERAAELALLAEEAGLANGPNPAGVAAACVYLAGQESGAAFTQTDLAEFADVTATTLRSRYYEMRETIA